MTIVRTDTKHSERDMLEYCSDSPLYLRCLNCKQEWDVKSYAPPEEEPIMLKKQNRDKR